MRINDSFNTLDKNKSEIEEKFVNCKEKLISFDYNNNSLKERLELDKEKALKECELEGFLSFENAKENIIDKSIIERYKKEVEVYKETVSKIHGIIESLLNKIDNRNINEEEFSAIEKSKNNKEIQINQIKEEASMW